MTYKIIIALGLAGLLAACSQTDDSEPSSTAPEKTVTEELQEKTEEVVEAAKEEAKELEEMAVARVLARCISPVGRGFVVVGSSNRYGQHHCRHPRQHD